MAIVFNCPHCDHPYRLKDDLAGKQATCKNANCRQRITIPAPVGLRIADLGGILPDDAPADTATAPPADVEAAALAALNETAKEKEESVAASDIPMTCPHCDHKWTEALSKAGKNTLCPNEECRQRIKVPEPKKGTPKENWRSTASGKPSLAKENFEKPTDVMDAEARVVSREAYIQGGGAEQDYEPVPFKHKFKIAMLILAPLLLIGAGIYAIVAWRSSRGEELKMEPALAEFAAAREELDPVQAGFGAAILEMAAGEHALHPQSMDKDKALAQAHLHFTKARGEIQQASQKDTQGKAALERNALLGELARAQIGLGGTEEQVKANERYRWVPGAADGRALRVNEQIRTVHKELQTTLAPMMTADFDTKAIVLRRLVRDLEKKGQPDLAAELPVFFFSESEMPEAKAIVGLELYRPTRSAAGAPGRIADELKSLLSGGVTGRVPTPASAQTLWQVVGTEKAPTLFGAPSGGSVTDPTRLAYTGVYLLKDDNPTKALELARLQGGSLNGQLRALLLVAEWAPDPGPAFDSAISLVNLSSKSKKESPPGAILVRLAQLAAAANRPDQAKTLADLAGDDGAKAWAKGSGLAAAATPENKNKLEDAAMEIPDDAKKLRAGHFFGRLWLARQNGRLTSASDATKPVNLWPKGTVKPFGLAGIAVAQHEK